MRSADRRRLIGGATLSVLVGLSACVASPDSDPDVTGPSAPPVTASVSGTIPLAGATVPALRSVTTANDPGGNRLVTGSGAMPAAPRVIELEERPTWLLAVPFDDRLVWVVTLESGTVAGFESTPSGFVEVPLNLDALPAETPPAAAVGEEGLLVLAPPPPTASFLTNPIALGAGGLGFVGSNGSVVTAGVSGNRTFDLDALPDGRLVESDDGRVAVLAGPTDRYPHGVLGDLLEGSAVAIVSPETQSIVDRIDVEPDVIEGVAPMWADIDDDGVEELIVTLSHAGAGARLAVVSESGSITAESQAIGTSNRWRHQVAVGPFGPNGETELAEVITPHLGGIVTFRSLQGSELVRVAALSGYTSHIIGSRNLDMVVAGDGNGDGRLEVILPSQARTELAGIQRSADDADVVWTVDLEARVVTNIAAADLGGRLVLGLGTDDGRLLVWE